MYRTIAEGTAVLVLFAILFAVGWTAQGWRMDAEIATIKAEQSKAAAEAVAATRFKEQVANNAANKIRKQKDEEVAVIRAKLDAALIQLRDRPQRAGARTVPSTPSCNSSPQGADGTQLYREDAEFLTREAARADEIRAALKQCEEISAGK
jgi:hypothetical protein